ncbi:MAG: hypothetical protein R3E66_21080 [bacterium]
MSKHLQLSAEATQANAEFLTARERLVQAVRVQGVEQGHGASMALDLTRATDAWIMSLWTAACEGIPARLFALGGYGRSELSFASDVDLVIEVSPQTVATSECLLAVERFMAWCRETRVKVSHSVRTPEQTQTSFAEDFRTAVSYLDIRGLNDDAEGLRREAVEFLRGDDHGVGFVRNLFEGYRQRHGRFGQTIYRLEPELKNGPGGLRDLHAIRWAGLVTQGRDVGFEDALGFGAEQRHTYAIGQAWIRVAPLHACVTRPQTRPNELCRSRVHGPNESRSRRGHGGASRRDRSPNATSLSSREGQHAVGRTLAATLGRVSLARETGEEGRILGGRRLDRK